MALPAQRKAQLAHRKRLSARGVKRVEVNVHKDDVALLRKVVEALASPERKAEVRSKLRELCGGARAQGFKELLASASLEGVDLRRNREGVREIDL